MKIWQLSTILGSKNQGEAPNKTPEAGHFRREECGIIVLHNRNKTGLNAKHLRG